MLKNIALASVASLIALSSPAQAAKAAKPTLDCSRASTGAVRVLSTGQRLSLETAAKLATSCLAKADKRVIEAKAKALKKAAIETGDEDSHSCEHDKGLQAITLTSWMSERPSHVGGPDST